MTNATYAQLRNTVLRGGRLTKFKGIAASIAPMVGAVVIAGLSAEQAQAANECGSDLAGVDTVNCAAGAYAAGITYAGSDGLELILNDATITVGNPGVSVTGTGVGDISVIGTNVGTVTTGVAWNHGLYSHISNIAGTATATALLTDGDVVTTGNVAQGVYAFTYGEGATLAQMSGGTITVEGAVTAGLISRISNTSSSATATALMTNGSITSRGVRLAGIFAQNSGQGLALAQMDGGTVKTERQNTVGIGAFGETIGSGATVTALLIDGDVETISNSSSGLRAFNRGNGITTAQIDGGTVKTSGVDSNGVSSQGNGLREVLAQMNGGAVTTGGVNAHGLFSRISNIASTATATALLTGGDVISTGNGAHGVSALTSGLGLATATVSGTSTVMASGADADGIRAEVIQAGASYAAAVTDTAVVTGGSGLGAGIHTASVASSSGTIDVAAGATVDGSAGAAGILDGAGNVIVTTAGTVTGDAILGLGDDVFNLTGGVYTGDIYGDDVVASANYGNDTFNWSGGDLNSGFFGGNGSDTATITAGANYDGTETFDGGDDYGIADRWVDTLTFQGQTATTTGALVIKWENVIVDGGSLALTDGALTVGSDAGIGLVLTNAGVMDAGDAFALTGNLTTSTGGTFDATGGGAGVYSISGSVLNNGVVTTQDGAVGDVVTVTGDFAGTGMLLVDVDTATDTADTLDIAGDVTGGAAAIVVNSLSPLVATGNDITVVTVDGKSSASDFVLQGGSLTAGAFDYTLGQSGTNFVLAAAINSTGAVYEAAPSILGAFNRMSTLEQRVGNRHSVGTPASTETVDVFCKDASQNFRCDVTPEQSEVYAGQPSTGHPNTGVWVRFSGDRLDATTTTGSSIDSSTWGLQAGADFTVEPGDAGQWVLGVTGQYGQVSSTVTSALGFGTIDAEGFGVGATATWYGNTGSYVDLQGQMNWIDSDISSSAAGTLAEGEQSKAYALSAEVGHRFALNETSALVPLAQLMWGRVDGGSFTDSAGNAVDLGSNDSTIGRLGLAYEYTPETVAGDNQTKTYVIGNILHDFSGDSSVNVAGVDLSTGAAETTWGEIGLGGSYAMDANTTLYGEAAYRASFGGSSDNNGLSGTAGLRIQW